MLNGVPVKFVISGKVKLGLGKGRYFMSIPGYKKQFIKKLDMDPYPGTLNLKLSKDNVNVMDSIRKKDGILIKGFKSKERTFGDVLCYSAELSGIKCALVMPKKTTHTAVAEIISSKMLRKELGLKDGSMVKVSVTAS